MLPGRGRAARAVARVGRDRSEQSRRFGHTVGEFSLQPKIPTGCAVIAANEFLDARNEDRLQPNGELIACLAAERVKLAVGLQHGLLDEIEGLSFHCEPAPKLRRRQKDEIRPEIIEQPPPRDAVAPAHGREPKCGIGVHKRKRPGSVKFPDAHFIQICLIEGKASLTAGLLYGGAEIGFRYGQRYAQRTSQEIQAHVATVEGALLGLLALLLGFAFSMAMNRFEARKQAVLEEVNDLQTAYLRAHLLPARHRSACVRLLEEYVEARIAYVRAAADPVRIQESQEATVRLQIKLWAESVAAVRDDSNEVTTGYFVESLNRLIDDHTKRSIAMENHVPEVILLLLILVAVLTIAVTGYSSGLKGKRLKALRLILVVLISATLTVIIDLDRPRRGLIRVGEDGMGRLQKDLSAFHAGVTER